MAHLVLWKKLEEQIRPYYFQEKPGPRPIELQTMLRIYLLQIRFTFADEGAEKHIYDSYYTEEVHGLGFQRGKCTRCDNPT
ncbi:MAG: hypothetical protein LBB43_05765 [Spirochaetaceae bacterium]|nr:hypothetical protein [Spirochaetaceae bacterium]